MTEFNNISMQVMLLPSDPLDSRNIMLEGQPIFGHLCSMHMFQFTCIFVADT